LDAEPQPSPKKQKKVAVITNKNAGRGTPRAGLGRVIGSILATPYRHYDTATLGELDSAVRRIAADRPDIFAFAGGDGSVHQILTRLIREYGTQGIALPKLLYIPTGTMMNIGRSIGLDRMSAVDFSKRMAAKIAAQQRGEDVQFDVAHLNPMLVNDQYGFIYGSGLPVNLLHQYEKAPHFCEDRESCGFRCKWASPDRERGTCPRCGKKLIREGLGPWRAIQVIVGAFLSRRRRRELTKPVHARVTLPDGFDPPVAPYMTHTALMVATVDQLGMGCRGMPDAMGTPGHFMLRTTQHSLWGFAANLGLIWAGLPVPGMFDAVARGVTIEYTEPTVATIDGDMMPPSTLHRIECGPRLTFITG
jgi:diacylglycerol kinase family enzyme